MAFFRERNRIKFTSKETEGTVVFGKDILTIKKKLENLHQGIRKDMLRGKLTR